MELEYSRVLVSVVLYFTTDLINASTTSHFENVVTHGAAINMNQFVEKAD